MEQTHDREGPRRHFSGKDTLLLLLGIHHSLNVAHEGALHSIQVVGEPLHEFHLVLSQFNNLPLLGPQKRQQLILVLRSDLLEEEAGEM